MKKIVALLLVILGTVISVRYGIQTVMAKEEGDHAAVPDAHASGDPTPTPAPTAEARPAKVKLVQVSKNSPGCIVDEQAVDDIRAKRAELIELEKKLVSREGELAAKERALDEQIKKIDEIRADIKRSQEIGAKENEERVNKLVETFEAMSPKSIAGVVAKLDEQLAVTAMSKMSTTKLAKLLAALDPAKSSKLSEMLAGVSTVNRMRELSRDNSTLTKKRGGEKDDNANTESNHVESGTEPNGIANGRVPSSNAGNTSPNAAHSGPAKN